MARAVGRAESAAEGAGSAWERPLRTLGEAVGPLWRLLGSPHFAAALLAFLTLAGLGAVLVPQLPEQMRGNAAAELAWLELQRERFGPFTDVMRRLGLFNVVGSPWFIAALCLIAASLLAAMAARLPALWQGVISPPRRVPDAFYERAANRVALVTNDVARLEALLRAHRFRVERFEGEGATYLFADRFSWAQVGSFLSHLAVILLLAGGLVTWRGGYSNGLFIAEGASQPVFPVRHPEQMQVEVIDAVGRFDEAGTPIDYRSELVIYQGGQEVARGVTTVNDPLRYNGYRFHQAAYFGEGAALRVRDAVSGNTVFHEVLELRDRWPAPQITVRDARGRLLLRDTIVPTERLAGVWGTSMTVPSTDQDFWVGIRPQADGTWRLVVFGLSDEGARTVVPLREARRAGALEFTFRGVDGLPAVVAGSEAAPSIPGDSERSVVILSETPEGMPYLTIRGTVESAALTLFPNEPVRVGDREYLFEGRREFAGIEVRKDPGSTFIWAGVGLLLAGLVLTFYVPRLRLWVRVGGGRTVIAGLAERSDAFRAETRRLARALGVRFTTGEEGADG